MRIIDILNKMADGTLEDGFEFIYDNKVFQYNKRWNGILNADDTRQRQIGSIYKVESILNDKVIIIQTDEVEVEVIEDETEKIEPLPESGYMDLARKINELVQAVNELRKKK